MMRVHTAPVLAFVMDGVSVGNRPVLRFPHQAMNKHSAADTPV